MIDVLLVGLSSFARRRVLPALAELPAVATEAGAAAGVAAPRNGSRSGRITTSTKASASPPTTEPARKVRPL